MTETAEISDDTKLEVACQKVADAFGLPVKVVRCHVASMDFNLENDMEILKGAAETRKRRVYSQRKNPPMPAENLGPETRQVRRARDRALSKSLKLRRYRDTVK